MYTDRALNFANVLLMLGLLNMLHMEHISKKPPSQHFLSKDRFTVFKSSLKQDLKDLKVYMNIETAFSYWPLREPSLTCFQCNGMMGNNIHNCQCTLSELLHPHLSDIELWRVLCQTISVMFRTRHLHPLHPVIGQLCEGETGSLNFSL